LTTALVASAIHRRDPIVTISATAPYTPDQFTDATWEDILPLYEALVAQPLNPGDTEGIEAWLDEWSALVAALGEAASLANVNASCDTTDPVKEEAYIRFSGQIRPRADEQTVRLAKKLIETGYTRPDLESTIRRFRTDQDLFRPENVQLEQDLQTLNAEYNKITGGMTVNWRGEEIPIPRLSPFLLDPERATREEAWRLQFKPYIDQRDEIATVFDQQLEKRQRLARNAGFENYRDYTFESKYRYDYTPDDCETFHASVEQTFVPAIARRYEKRKQEMGVDSLRPWDTSHDPLGLPPLTPYESVDEWNSKSEAIFRRVDPAFGDYFATMRKEHLLDLESRKGKRPGGFCTSFPYRKRPFIFMNASGVGSDVRTLLHEAGHAFHGFESSKLPFIYQRQYGSEMAEVASMAMELLSSPYLKTEMGGFYEQADFIRARTEHLDGILEIFAWVATVDSFQHWLYTDAAASDRDARDAKWLTVWERFNPGVDWFGLETERTARWYKQLHLFLYPFYYIEYAIAQLGALQVWRNSLADQSKATADYRAALALGGSKPLPELFDRAGARLIFDAAGMAELVTLIETELGKLEQPAA
jgi:oligoendopeptidase F